MLPKVASREDYRAVWRKSELFVDAVRAIAEEHGLRGEPIAVARGTRPVFVIGDVYVKLGAMFFGEQYFAERDALRALSDAAAIDLATPTLLAHGVIEGWNYLAMSGLAGARIGDVWPTADRTTRVRLAQQAGALLARLHAVPVAPSEGLDPTRFRARLSSLARDVAAAHRGRNLLAPSPESIAAYVAEHAELLFQGDDVLVHADVTDDHLLVEGERITGLIDFGDAQLGPRGYEHVSPISFMFGGDREVIAAYFDGYGVRLDDVERARCMTFLLVHTWNDLEQTLRRAQIAGNQGVDAIARALLPGDLIP